MTEDIKARAVDIMTRKPEFTRQQLARALGCGKLAVQKLEATGLIKFQQSGQQAKRAGFRKTHGSIKP